MKFLHISDIHLGRRQVGTVGDYAKKRYKDFFDAFLYMIDYAVVNKLDAIIIAGDLFDKKEINPDILANTMTILDIARRNNIPVIAIEGNHDNFQESNSQDSWLLYLEDFGLLKRPYYKYEDEKYQFFPIVIDDINFYGIGYNGAFTDAVITAFAESIDDNDNSKNVLITHTAIAGDTLFHGTVKSDTIALLQNKCVYVAGGHFHKFSAYPKDNPFFFVPGSLEYWDHGEFKQKKGGVVFDTETREYQYINSKARTVVNISLVNDHEDLSDFYNYFYQELEKFQYDSECIVSIEIKNNSVYFPDSNDLEQLVYEKGVLKVFINFMNDSSKKYSELIGKNLLIEDIEEDIIKKWEHFSANIPQSLSTLKLLKQYQIQNTNDSLDNFKSLFDNWIESIIERERNEN